MIWIGRWMYKMYIADLDWLTPIVADSDMLMDVHN